MKRDTFYKVIIIVLLMINLVQISYLFLNKKPKNNSEKYRKPNAREILHLDPNQDIQFKEFSKIHHNVMAQLRESQKQNVRNYFLHPTDSLLNRIAAIETQKIKVTQKHFENMKSVLKEHQLPNYKKFKDEALKYILQ